VTKFAVMGMFDGDDKSLCFCRFDTLDEAKDFAEAESGELKTFWVTTGRGWHVMTIEAKRGRYRWRIDPETLVVEYDW
jgi:hypothetical protein